MLFYEFIAYFVLPVYVSNARVYLVFEIGIKICLALVLLITFVILLKLMLKHRLSEFKLIEKELYWQISGLIFL